MCHLIEVTFPINWANAEKLSPYTEPTQKDIPLIRGQCRVTFLYAEPKWNDKKLWISIWVSLIKMYSILLAPKCRGSWNKSKHKYKCSLVAWWIRHQTLDFGIAGSSPAKVIDFSSNCEECQRLRSEIHQKTNKLSVYGYGPYAT